MLKYLLLGRIGSGKEYFEKQLEKYGIKVAKSYTTRPKINDDDNMHYFISENEINEISNTENEISERVCETEHNGYKYFYTRYEIENADVIPIDPENVKTICDLYPDNIFRFIEIMASNEDRIKHAVLDADDKITAEEEFIAKCEEENEEFCKFEDNMKNSKLNINNILVGHVLTNDFGEYNDIDFWCENIPKCQNRFKNVSTIVKKLSENDIIQHDCKLDKYLLCANDETGKAVDKLVSLDYMTEQILIDKEGMYQMMNAWLGLDDTKLYTGNN